MQCAQKAKAALNGADIYAGCCTLKIEYARVRRRDSGPFAVSQGGCSGFINGPSGGTVVGLWWDCGGSVALLRSYGTI